jgi:hypothetical protein
VEDTSIELISKLIDEELNRIVKEANGWANWYWTNVKEDRKENNVYARFGTRVRCVNGNFQALWYTNTYFRDSSGKGRTISNHLNKGRGFKYTKGSFKNALDFEKELIYKTEEEYAKLRERYSYLSNLRKAYNMYMKNVNKLEAKPL